MHSNYVQNVVQMVIEQKVRAGCLRRSYPLRVIENDFIEGIRKARGVTIFTFILPVLFAAFHLFR